jgi:hypothetical protein
MKACRTRAFSVAFLVFLAACQMPAPEPPRTITVGETTVTVGGRVRITAGGQLN